MRTTSREKRTHVEKEGVGKGRVEPTIWEHQRVSKENMEWQGERDFQQLQGVRELATERKGCFGLGI